MARQLLLFEHERETKPAVATTTAVDDDAATLPGTFVALDFETADVAHRFPIALGLVRVEAGAIAAEAYHLIHAPARVFHRANTAVHGIQPAEVADAAPFPEVWQAVQPLLDSAAFLAAHHAPFDRGVLAAVCRRYKLQQPSLSWTCTRQLAKRTWSLPRGGLKHVASYLGLELNHHQALSDARACANIVLRARSQKQPLSIAG